MACAVDPRTREDGPYRALGQEPGWSLEIRDGLIRYVGDYGDVRIDLPAGRPQPTPDGRRYESSADPHHIRIDIAHRLCHDVMSGFAYADAVLVIADNREVRGCGGARKPSEDR